MNVLRGLYLSVRRLRQARSYAIASVVTLAIAIGANTAIFSAVHSVLLDPAPIRQASELVVAWEGNASRDLQVVEVPYRSFEYWASHSKSFESVAAIGSSTWPSVLEGRNEPATLAFAGVSASFFETLGVEPLIGRGLTTADDAPGAPRVAVLSYGSWHRLFAGEPRVIGATALLGGVSHVIVGVMPRGLDFPTGVDYWAPVLPILVDASRDNPKVLEEAGVLYVLARLREGASSQSAAAELELLAQQRAKTAPRLGTQVIVTGFLNYTLGPAHQALWILLAAVAILLLVACANVSGFMLSRVAMRRRDDAIHLALGAAPSTIGWGWAGEALILAGLGGSLGLATGWAISKLIVAAAASTLPRLAEMEMNIEVALTTSAAVLIAALLCSIGPVRQARKADVLSALSEGSKGTSGPQAYRFRSLLLVGQIGLAVALLAAAALVVGSFRDLRRIDLGFQPQDVATLLVQPRAAGSGSQWFQAFLAQLEDIPEVEAAGAVYLRPLALGPIGQETWVLLEGQADTSEARSQNPVLNYQVATPGYFEAMRIELKRGRRLHDADDTRAPRVALVSESTAHRLWPGQDPIGKQFLTATFAGPNEPITAWRTVVGVVADVRYRGLNDPRLDVYDPALQAALGADDVVVLTKGDAASLIPAIKAVARRLDSTVLIDGATTMDQIVSTAMRPWSLAISMLTLFATIAFVISMAGLSSLVSLHVTSRRREFAIHISLGAHRSHILSSVLRFAGLRALLGIAVGAAATIGVAALIRGELVQLRLSSSWDLAFVGCLVMAVVLAASYLPAARAASSDPAGLLREG